MFSSCKHGIPPGLLSLICFHVLSWRRLLLFTAATVWVTEHSCANASAPWSANASAHACPVRLPFPLRLLPTLLSFAICMRNKLMPHSVGTVRCGLYACQIISAIIIFNYSTLPCYNNERPIQLSVVHLVLSQAGGGGKENSLDIYCVPLLYCTMSNWQTQRCS